MPYFKRLNSQPFSYYKSFNLYLQSHSFISFTPASKIEVTFNSEFMSEWIFVLTRFGQALAQHSDIIIDFFAVLANDSTTELFLKVRTD